MTVDVQFYETLVFNVSYPFLLFIDLNQVHINARAVVKTMPHIQARHHLDERVDSVEVLVICDIFIPVYCLINQIRRLQHILKKKALMQKLYIIMVFTAPR